jgi:hypothetical protein
MQELFGKPPLFAGERESDFNMLLARVAVDLKPVNAIEWFWAYDIAVLVWEAQRWRRLRASMLREAQQKELQKAIHNSLAMKGTGAKYPQLEETASQLARDWVAGYAVHEVVDECFSRSLSSADSVTAKVFLNHLDAIERIDRLIASVMARHGAIVREIDRRRDAFARRAREVSRDMIEVEVVDESDKSRESRDLGG